MSLTHRQLSIDRAILAALAAVPASMLLPEDILRPDAGRMVRPQPTMEEMDERLRYLNGQRRIAGLDGETGMQWQITDAGRLWRAQNP